MRHLFAYLGVVFFALFLFVVYRDGNKVSDVKPVLRVYASSSFISQWGPGPWLKNEFEKNCQCRVEFQEALDSYLLMQKIKSESARGVDVVMGLDGFDLELAQSTIQWKNLNIDMTQFDQGLKKEFNFVPYNYSQLAFVYRSSELEALPRSLKDLSNSEYKNQIALIDPRASSLGIQYLLWITSVYGEKEGLEIIRGINSNVKVYASNWSSAYGLFREKQVKLVLSYITSPIYHRLEEKSLDVQAAQFVEGHPIQVEYLGVPQFCKQCDLANQFVELVLSDLGQKFIMEKNYMFPVYSRLKEGSVFSEVPPYEKMTIPSLPLNEKERLIKQWNQIRKNQ